MSIENPYQSPGSVSLNVCVEAASSQKRRFLDFRALATLMCSVALGAVMWEVQSFITGNSMFDPDFRTMIGWFIFCGFVSGMADPRNPWINWPSLYIGAYIVPFPFFPRDPLIPLALIMGVGITGICVLFGTFLPSAIAFVLPLKSSTMRKWAGYID